MFNFTTTTVINSTNQFFASVANELRVKSNHINLKNANVEACYKAAYKAPANDSAVVTLPQAEGAYRLKIYISLDGSENSYYANDFVYKGKPLYIEFKGNTKATDLAKQADKYQLLTMERPLLKLSKGTTEYSLKVDAVDEYQRITKLVVEKFDDTKGQVAGIGNLGMFVETDDAVTITHGNVGKGSYTQILKDLRLPTAANTRFTSPNNEMPVPNAKYDQYTIYYCKNRGIMGGDAVGELVKSRTCHVFFVNQAVSTEWEAAITAAKITVTEAGKSVSADAAEIPEAGSAVSQASTDETKSVLD